MTAEPQGSKWVGNAGLIIGLPWDKRKSLPRDSKGFEPIEGYFDRTSSPEDNDSDSSVTDTEELVRQEREKRIKAEAQRRAVEDAKRNAAYLVKLAAAKKQTDGPQQLPSTEEESGRGDGRIDTVDMVSGTEANGDLDVGSNVEVFAKSVNGNHSEELYSPNASAAIEGSPSSARKSIRLLPARLSFSGGEGEHSSDADLSESQKYQQKSTDVGTKSKRDLRSKFSATSDKSNSASLAASDGGSTIIPPAKHISTTTEASFHPTQTSTQLKDRRKQVKKKSEVEKPVVTSKKPLSSYRTELSDSESERDEMLETLLAEDAEHFQGLSQLTKSKMAATTAKSGKGPRRRFAKKSTGNMAGVRKTRKSVTFVSESGSEVEGDFEKGKNTTVSKPPPPPTSVDDVYMSFDEVHVDVHAYSPRRGGKPRSPKKTAAPKKVYSEEETDESEAVTGVSSQETDQDVPSESERPRNRSRVVKTAPSAAGAAKRRQRLKPEEAERSAHRTKDVRGRVSETPDNVQVPGSEANSSVLKDVTLVLNKSTIRQSQWFVPDMDLPGRRRTAGATGTKSRRNAKMGKTEQEPSTRYRVPPPAPSAVDELTEGEITSKTKRKRGQPPKSAASKAVAVVSSESELEGESIAVQGQGDVAEEETTSKPKKKKKGRSSKPAATQTAAVVSSESGREGESETTEGRTTSDPDKVVINPKTKRGRQLKSATIRSIALESSESEFDEFLEKLRPSQQSTNEGGGRRKKRTNGTGKQPNPQPTTPSKLEQIVEGLKSVRRTSPRKTQSSASSKSKLEGEQSTESPSEVSGQKHEAGQALKESKAAESSSVQSYQEMDMEGVQMTTFEETINDGSSLDSEVVYDQSALSTLEAGVEEETTVKEYKPKAAKQGRRKQQTKSAVSDSSEAQAEDAEAIKNTAVKKSKRGIARSQKSVAGQPLKSASSENEAEHIEIIQQQKRELEKKKKKNAAPKQGRRQLPRTSSVSAHPPVSTTSESEMEEVTDGKQGRRRSLRNRTSGTSEDQAASESENGILKPKKKRSKTKHETATINNKDESVGGSEGLSFESGEEPQYVLSDYEDGDVASRAAPSATKEDVNVRSKVTKVGRSVGGASKGSGEKEVDLSAAASIDVSVLPRLNKRKRGKGNKLVLCPRSKKRKKNPVAQEPKTPDGPADFEIYSMSTSGDGDSLDEMEITKSGGGRRYRRVKVEATKSQTPGVRRGSRTRIAPVRHWENEQVEYDTKRKSGIVLKSVLIPLDHEEEQEMQQPRKAKAAQPAGGSRRRLKGQEDEEFSPLRYTDNMGNAQEQPIVRTLTSAPCINCSGEAVTDDSDADVIIHKLRSSLRTSKGVMTFGSLGEKPRSSTRTYDMFFYVLKGKLLFQVNDQEFTLFPHSSIDIPGGCRYCIRNMQHSQAQIVFSTHHIEPQPSE